MRKAAVRPIPRLNGHALPTLSTSSLWVSVFCGTVTLNVLSGRVQEGNLFRHKLSTTTSAETRQSQACVCARLDQSHFVTNAPLIIVFNAT